MTDKLNAPAAEAKDQPSDTDAAEDTSMNDSQKPTDEPKVVASDTRAQPKPQKPFMSFAALCQATPMCRLPEPPSSEGAYPCRRWA